MGKPVTLEGTARPSDGGRLQTFVLRERLVYLTNDSETYDLRINFDATTEQGGNFTLLSGETVSDIPMTCMTISVQAVVPAGVDATIVSVPFRALGV